ncbi:hypothetical protein [Streptomyces sp. NPDC058657]|uniref:hypothetical protein n=1 Tax=unclassified Streptomyces TaxID=2593676 RepID=UPI0036462220
MTCRPCTTSRTVRLHAYPAGDARASLKAAHAATEARQQTTAPVHIHYEAADDTFVVLRTEEN